MSSLELYSCCFCSVFIQQLGYFFFGETCKMFRDFVLGFRGVVHFSCH